MVLIPHNFQGLVGIHLRVKEKFYVWSDFGMEHTTFFQLGEPL